MLPMAKLQLHGLMITYSPHVDTRLPATLCLKKTKPLLHF